MGQHTRILTQIAGFGGWKVAGMRWESASGQHFVPIAGYDLPSDAILVLSMTRRWAPRCAHCLAIARAGSCHEHCPVRRWADLPWAGHRVVLEYSPMRVKCRRCGSHSVELLAWAEPKQRQTRRQQQHVALDAFSMPLIHVATKYGLSWHTVRRAEVCAITRWDSTRPPEVLQQVGVDEKWLGCRHRRPEKFVTIVSNLETGTPLWIGYGRGQDTLAGWIGTLSAEQKLAIRLFAMDMHAPFRKAVESDPGLKHVAIAHDPFHIMKRAGEALNADFGGCRSLVSEYRDHSFRSIAITRFGIAITCLGVSRSR